MKALVATVASAAFLLFAGAAQAITPVTSSNITSPANGAYILANDDIGSTLTVTGTSNGTGGTVDLYCFYGSANSLTLATGVTINSDGTFSDTVPLKGSHILGYACRLRAQPSGDTTESAAFSGPSIAPSEFDSTGSGYVISSGTNAGARADYLADGTTFSSYVNWYSAGSCGPATQSFDASLAESNFAFNCGGSLYADDGISRSEIQVDGNNAYVAGAVTGHGLENSSGFPSLTVSQNWNPANGFESTQETDGVVECPAPDSYQPDFTTCPSFSSAGVQLQRSIAMTGTHQVAMTDTWSSTDGHAHTVSAEYDDESESASGSAAYEFPGETAFSRHAIGDVIAGPATAPGSIFNHTDAAAPDNNPFQEYGAITFSSAPSQFVFSSSNEYVESQTLSVPAGSSVKISYIYSFGPSLEQVQALALQAQDQLKTPAVSITSPHNGSKAKGKTVKVSGTATAGSGIKSVSVNGHAASLGSGGSWSATVPLHKGTNTLTATATSNSGLSASALVAVNGKACVVPGVTGLSLSKAQRKIKHAGCTVSKIKKQASSIAKGHATGTKPHKGKKRKPGANITLYVSKGP